jgi:sulfur carrier protein ThiS
MAKITGFRIGQGAGAIDVQVDAEGATLKQILTIAGVKQDGNTFIINGSTVTPDTRVFNDTRVEVTPAAKGGAVRC